MAKYVLFFQVVPRVSLTLGVPETARLLNHADAIFRMMQWMNPSMVFESKVTLFSQKKKTDEFAVDENVLCDQLEGNLRMK